MEKMVRFGISIPPHLLEKFDEIIDEKGYANRSEAIRDMIRDRLITEHQDEGRVIGTLTILYDHDVRGVMEKLTNLQHHHFSEVSSTMHVHVDEHTCLEVIVVEGEADTVRKFANTLIATKGVKHGKLVLTSSTDL